MDSPTVTVPDIVRVPLYTLKPSPPPSYSQATPLPDHPLKPGETILEVEPLAVIPSAGGRCERCLRLPGTGGSDLRGNKEGVLRMCGKCRCVGYCSDACKIADLASHNPLCSSLPSITHHLTALLHTTPAPSSNTPEARVTKHDVLTALLVAKILGRYCDPSTEGGRGVLDLVKSLLKKDVVEIRRLLESSSEVEDPGVEEWGDATSTRPRPAQALPKTILHPELLTLLTLLPCPPSQIQPLTVTSRILSTHLRFSHPHPSIPTSTILFFATRFPSNAFVLSDAWGKEVGIGCVPAVSRAFDHVCGGVAAVVTTRWGTGGGSSSTSEGHEAAGSAKRHEDEGRVIVGVRTIKPIGIGEQINIAYLDPILDYPDRQRFLSHRYGFDCVCSLCTFQGGLRREGRAQVSKGTTQVSTSLEGKVLALDEGLKDVSLRPKREADAGRDEETSLPPGSDESRSQPTPEEFMRIFQLAIGRHMRKSIGSLLEHHVPSKRTSSKQEAVRIPLPSRLAISRLPSDLLHCLEPKPVTELTTLFSDAANGSDGNLNGDWTVASVAGAHVLAVYVVVYGWRWPLTGLHLLELAKVVYNAYVSLAMTNKNGGLKRELLLQCKVYLCWAEESLGCSGALQSGGGNVGDRGPTADLTRLHRCVEGDLREVLCR